MSEKRFILSDASVNSYGFSIDMEKLDVSRFEKNPVMLYNHYQLIGRWKDIKLENGQLTAVPEFMDDADEETALKVKRRVEKGFLKGASLGIQILESEKIGNNPPKVVAEVMEASIVDIPSNKNAIALYDKDGQKLEGDTFKLALQSISKPQSKSDTMTKIKLSATVSQKTGLPAELDLSAVEQKLTELADANSVMEEKLKALEEEKINALIDSALSDGRITADKKDDFKKLAQTDYDLAKATIEALPKAEKLAGKEKPTATMSDDRSNWTFADWRKKDTAGLLRIKAEDPERYQQIINS